jgi:hypothetical protein
MARHLFLPLALAAALAAVSTLEAADAKVRKVLPCLLDREGRASLHPSLYERDAYQAHLRQKPDEVGGLRFDIQWSAPKSGTSPLELRLELRGSATATATNGAAASTNAFVITRTVEAPRFGSRWTQITLDDTARRQVGDVTAWRATLVREGRELASTQSFLW